MNFQKFRRCCNNYIYTYAVSTEFTGVGVHRGVDREEVVTISHTSDLCTCDNMNKKMNTNIKIWEFLFEDFSNGVTVESYANCSRRSAIEDDLAMKKSAPNCVVFFSLTKSDISSYGPLNDTSEPRKYDVLQHRCRWFWRITCSKLFARDTISSAIACVRVK